MEMILDLLKKDLSIICGFYNIGMTLRCLDEDISIDNVSIYKCFKNFSSANFEEVYRNLLSIGVSVRNAEEIVKALRLLKETYDDYKVNNLDELEKLILNLWNTNKSYSDELIKYILLIVGIESECRDLPKSSNSILEIYKDIVNNNMIVDPNIPIGTSLERLYIMLPEDSSCYEQNLEIISNQMIDWSVYTNGRNPFEHFCALYNRSKTDEEKKYYHDLIIKAIYSSCSLFNNMFKLHPYSDKTRETINYYFVSIENKLDSTKHFIRDEKFKREIQDLLLTDELFNHQMELYTEKNDEAEEAIKKLILLREERQTSRK